MTYQQSCERSVRLHENRAGGLGNCHHGSPRPLQTLKTAPSARLGALDAITGRLYLPTAKLGPPKPPQPWPTVVPGTFAFLVEGEP
ncbi:MAG TPA: hypothetical protein VK130_12430 [Steroidobacteraceae bacterium]|nr:hypothetical protein [Steroidobacteraceae bacterium]